MSEDRFVVDAIKPVDEPDALTLVFEDKSGARRPVTIARPKLVTLLSALQTRIEAGSVTPISSRGVFPGQRFALDAYEVLSRRDGSARIVFYIRLPDENDRGVTLPLDLTRAEVDDLLNLLRPKT